MGESRMPRRRGCAMIGIGPAGSQCGSKILGGFMAKTNSHSSETGMTTRGQRLTLKQLIRSNGVFVGGIVAEYARPSLFKIYERAGFDFVFIEYEHGYFEPTMLAASI